MEAHSDTHLTWRRGRAVRMIVGASVATALVAGTLLPAPAFAISNETEAALTETQKSIESSASALDSANSNLAALQKQQDENEARISELESKLPAVQDKASRAMRDMYKYKKNANSLMSFVLNTKSLDDLVTTVKYMGQVQNANTDAVEELNELQSQLESEKAELAAARAQAEAEKAKAVDALAQAQRLREAAQQQAERELQAEAEALAQEALRDHTVQAGTEGGMQSAPAAPANPGAVNWNVDQQTFVSEWTNRIDAYLAGSPLAGQGATFANAAWKYGVDPRWSPAISNTESSKGRHCFKSHNAWGWGNASWGSWEEAIDAHVAGLARGYGYTLTVAAAKKYCPPNWYNWYNNTLSEMNRI